MTGHMAGESSASRHLESMVIAFSVGESSASHLL